ncbi:hypothetical protein CJU90_6191 [Yarrowia sp. C11]|nr:hypothetical protein CJU90_6191 [Yarrowia sp. C11]KAG5370899.1 hypothetical protein CKK34_1031 [Yarrowia sp. E02]
MSRIAVRHFSVARRVMSKPSLGDSFDSLVTQALNDETKKPEVADGAQKNSSRDLLNRLGALSNDSKRLQGLMNPHNMRDRLHSQFQSIPVTGMAQRTCVEVKEGGIQAAVRRLAGAANLHAKPQWFRQKFYERPCKKAWRIKTERSQRKFDAGVNAVFYQIRRAKQRGY